MATAATLKTRIAQITKLATSGAEDTLVIDALNDAYQQAVADSAALADDTTVTLTSGTASYALNAAPFNISGMLRIRYISVSGDGIDNRKLRRVSENEYLQLVQGVVSGPVTRYAVLGTSKIKFFGTPTSGVTATISYVKEPLQLVTSGAVAGTSELSPSTIPQRFHYSVLQNLATALAFEYARRPQEALFYHSQYERELPRLQAWVEDFGGLEMPDAIRAVPQDDPPRFPSQF